MSDPSIRACLRCGQPLSMAGSKLNEPARPARSSGRSRRRLFAVAGVALLIAACVGVGYYLFGVPGHLGIGSNGIPGTTNVLFSDPLTSNTSGWSSDIDHCLFQDGAYHVKNNIVCYAPTGSFDDASISVQAKQVAGSPLLPYGIVIRRVSTGNWYEFDIDSNGNWGFVKVANDTAFDLINSIHNAAIKTGLNTTNTLLVQAKGSHFTFFVNGTQVGQANDTTFASGGTGLAVRGADAEVAYTNFEITK